jgi:hypothetical protein
VVRLLLSLIQALVLRELVMEARGSAVVVLTRQVCWMLFNGSVLVLVMGAAKRSHGLLVRMTDGRMLGLVHGDVMRRKFTGRCERGGHCGLRDELKSALVCAFLQHEFSPVEKLALLQQDLVLALDLLLYLAVVGQQTLHLCVLAGRGGACRGRGVVRGGGLAVRRVVQREGLLGKGLWLWLL